MQELLKRFCVCFTCVITRLHGKSRHHTIQIGGGAAVDVRTAAAVHTAEVEVIEVGVDRIR